MDWDLLRVFLAVARTGRLLSAARGLGVEHTTVARRLAALEAQVGEKLFYRTATGYRLTPSGERVLTRAEAVERLALEIQASARDPAAPASGRVRIALLDEFASHWFAPLLPELRRRYPGIEPELVVGPRQLDLTRGEADIAVRAPEPRQPGLTATRLAKVASGLYATKRFARRHRLRKARLEALRGVPLLVYSSEYDRLQNAAWFARLLDVAPVGLVANTTHSLLAAVRADAGVGVLPRFVARVYPELVPLSEDASVNDMWLAMHTEYRNDPRMRAVAGFLRENAGALEVQVQH